MFFLDLDSVNWSLLVGEESEDSLRGKFIGGKVV